MATAVELPQLGNTVDECIITRWVMRKGDAVSIGDVIAEIETDKTTFEITAPVDGIVLETFFDEGALVPVFTNLCVIGDRGESIDAFRPSAGAVERPASSPVEQQAGGTSAPRVSRVEPRAMSPRARKFAAERNFLPSGIIGSGPGGRVLEDDLRRAYTASRTRDTIARRMRESLASTAQYTLHTSAGASGLLALREKIKTSQGKLPDVTINDLVTFCTVRALLETPDLNAEFINGAIVRHSEVHLGFACDTPRGLIVPVVRNAHTLTIGELAARMKALAAQALQGTIAAGDLSGGTCTISNLGGLGVESFTPLINPPQVAILGVGAIQLKPVRVEGAVQFIDSIGLSLTCDHQAIDGAPGARFLRVLTEKIENVEELCTL